MSRDENESIMLLQKYIPEILQNEVYFNSYADYILKVHDFEVDKEHLRKKLNVYLKESFRMDAVRLAYRLLRGVCNENINGKENWIWLNGKYVGAIAYDVVGKTS